MAIEERRTNKERRAEARAERKRLEEEQQRAAKKKTYTGLIGGIVIVAFLAGGTFFALDNRAPAGDAEMVLARATVEDARNDAGCEVLVDREPLADAAHHDPTTAPPADVLYASSSVRPAHSGPHFAGASQPLGGIPSSPVDERLLTHNLEHGSVIVWFDPETVDSGTQRAMENWMTGRQRLGYEGAGGGNVFISPSPIEISSGKPIAMRAWGVAMDCDSWDESYADGFLVDHWGTHGIAPERNLSPYPASAIQYGDGAVEDNTEAPTTDRHGTEGATDPDVGTESPTDPDVGTEPPATEDATPAPSES